MEPKTFRRGEPVTAQFMTDLTNDVIAAEKSMAETKAEVLEIVHKAENGEFNGKNVYVKYNTTPIDSGASETWLEGMGYIGFVFTSDLVAPATGYRWAKFTGPAGVAGAPGSPGRQGADGNGIYVSSQEFGTGVNRYDVSNVTYNKDELAPGDLIISAKNFNVVSVRSLTSDGFMFLGEYKFNIQGAQGPAGATPNLTDYATKTYVDNAITTALNTVV